MAFGLILRDADVRLVATSAEVRRAERMRIARELHDLVTHHVTGIAVRAQAAQIGGHQDGLAIDDDQTYTEIQEAAAASLNRPCDGSSACSVPSSRRSRPPLDPRRPRRSGRDGSACDDRYLAGGPCRGSRARRVRDAGTGSRSRPSRTSGATRPAPPGRRHRRASIPAATIDTLVLEIVNDGMADTAITGEASARYGLTGMRERVTALSGTLHAGPERGSLLADHRASPLERRPKARAARGTRRTHDRPCAHRRRSGDDPRRLPNDPAERAGHRGRGEASDGESAVRQAIELRPDVTVMDIRMPGLDGIEATRLLAGRHVADPLRIVVVTTYDTDENVYLALRARAIGFLIKDSRPPLLIHAVRTAFQGESLISPAVLIRLLSRWSGEPPDRPATPRNH